MNWVQKACDRIMDGEIEDRLHHDARRVVQASIAEMGVAPHVAEILNHAITDAPEIAPALRQPPLHPEKRQALTQWVRRPTRMLAYNPNDVMLRNRPCEPRLALAASLASISAANATPSRSGLRGNG